MRTKIKEILTKGGGGKIKRSAELYLSVLDGIEEYPDPHVFIATGYQLYQDIYFEEEEEKKKVNPDNADKEIKLKPSLNGKVFEYLICETLIQADIKPLYYQARFKQVPNADFDITLYNTVRPVVLSAKTSLRERYKQADLEGIALKQVYRNAKSYLITLSDEQVKTQEKIESGDITGLQGCIRADKTPYDDLLEELATQEFTIADEVMPIDGKPILGND